MADIAMPRYIARDTDNGDERRLERLFGLGGLPAVAVVLLGTLLILVAAAFVVWVVEARAPRLDAFAEAAVIAITLLCVVLSLVLLLAPICHYVSVGQTRRLEVIKGYYSPGAIARYFDQFWAGRDGFAALIAEWRERDSLSAEQRDRLYDELRARFNKLLEGDFGCAMYMMPMVLLTAVAGVVMYFGFLGGISLAKAWAGGGVGDKPVSLPLLGIKLDLISIAAIFGAYAWVTADAITRNYQATFHPSNLLWYALRLIIAIPLGEAVSMLSLSGTSIADVKNATSAIPGSGAFLAFVISTFSLDAISKYLSIAVNKLTTNAQTGSAAEREDLTVKLPGVDEEIARRLAAEGVTTIAQLVSADPVRLSIRSGLSFDFVLGLVDAAILWSYAGGKIQQLREFGFKGASNVLLFAQLSGAGDRDLAIAYGEAETRRAAAETRRARAAAALEAAEQTHDADPDLAALRREVDAIEAEIVASGDGAQATLLRRRGGAVARRLAETQERLDEQLSLAHRVCSEAEAEAADAAVKARSARDALRNAPPRALPLLQQIAVKTSIPECGFEQIIAQLIRDQYADFIYRLLDVQSAPA